MEAVANREGKEMETWQCIVEVKGLSLDLMSLCDINMEQHAELAQVRGRFFFFFFLSLNRISPTVTPTQGGKMDTMLQLTEIGFLALQNNKKNQYKIIYPNKTKQKTNKKTQKG